MKPSSRDNAILAIAPVAARHTMAELVAMEWPTANGGRARFSARTIRGWLRSAGVSEKRHMRPNELSPEAKAEIRRRYLAGERSMVALSKIPWKMKDGAMRLVTRHAIYDVTRRAQVIAPAKPSRTSAARPSMTDAAWNHWMLFGDSGP